MSTNPLHSLNAHATAQLAHEEYAMLIDRIARGDVHVADEECVVLEGEPRRGKGCY